MGSNTEELAPVPEGPWPFVEIETAITHPHWVTPQFKTTPDIGLVKVVPEALNGLPSALPITGWDIPPADYGPMAVHGRRLHLLYDSPSYMGPLTFKEGPLFGPSSDPQPPVPTLQFEGGTMACKGDSGAGAWIMDAGDAVGVAGVLSWVATTPSGGACSDRVFAASLWPERCWLWHASEKTATFVNPDGTPYDIAADCPDDGLGCNSDDPCYDTCTEYQGLLASGEVDPLLPPEHTELLGMVSSVAPECVCAEPFEDWPYETIYDPQNEADEQACNAMTPCEEMFAAFQEAQGLPLDQGGIPPMTMDDVFENPQFVLDTVILLAGYQTVQACICDTIEGTVEPSSMPLPQLAQAIIDGQIASLEGTPNVDISGMMACDQRNEDPSNTSGGGTFENPWGGVPSGWYNGHNVWGVPPSGGGGGGVPPSVGCKVVNPKWSWEGKGTHHGTGQTGIIATYSYELEGPKCTSTGGTCNLSPGLSAAELIAQITKHCADLI